MSEEIIRRASWSTMDIQSVAKRLSADLKAGLSEKEAEKRRERYGENIFDAEDEPTILERMARQLFTPLTLILLAAGVVAIVLQEYLDATVIFIALAINVIIGVFQEERASRSFERLRASQEKYATVLRGGRKLVIPAEMLVPGDTVYLEAGSYVPADIRLSHAGGLTINEAALTGEWLGVDKDSEVAKEEKPVSEQRNMAWMGTLVSGGFGEGIVVSTGSETELGHIAGELSREVDVKTPIQRNIRRLAVFLSYLVLLIVTLIFAIGVFRGEAVGEMLLISVAVAVSVVPEGLPVAVTIVLVFGMERILKAGGLVRNLLAAETLGGTTVILTDKTGTLTQAKMHIDGIVTLVQQKGAAEDEKAKLLALEAAVRASDAFVEEGSGKKGKKEAGLEGEEGDGVSVRGRPMERAIILAALDSGIKTGDGAGSKRIDFLAFDSERRYAASLNETEGGKGKKLYVTGAPEYLVEHSEYVVSGSGKREEMTSVAKRRFMDAIKKAGSEGSRTLGVGYKEVTWESISEGGAKRDEAEKGKPIDSLVFAGILVFSDPIREDVFESIEKARGAGARVIMLTGDNRETATKIARDAGIATEGERAIVGSEIEKMSDKELLEKLETSHIFARVLPSQKLRMARLLRRHGDVVAMTGDGINDAPALRNADIGIAVGSGTEVAKEASDLVLVKNSFSIIVSAIEEGRRIIDNLKKVVTHLLSTSFHEVFIIGAALIFGLPLPILPTQIIWANIIEEGLLNFGFAFEPVEQDVMKRDPRSERIKNVMTDDVRKLILIAGIITGIFSLLLYIALLIMKLPIEEIRTIIFVVLSLDSIFFAISLKRLREPFWRANLLSNKYLLFAIFVSAALLLGTLTLPPLKTLLSLTSLTPLEMILLVGAGLFNLATIEYTKWFVFRKKVAQELVV